MFEHLKSTGCVHPAMLVHNLTRRLGADNFVVLTTAVSKKGVIGTEHCDGCNVPK